MQNVEASTIITAAGGIIVFLGSIVLAGIRATISSIKRDIERLYERTDKIPVVEKDLHLMREECKERHHLK